MRVLTELQVPQLLLFDTLRVGLEVVHQVCDLLDLGLSVRVHNACHVLHQVEVGSHGVSQASQLAEFGDKGYLVTRSPVLVDQQWLVGILDGFVVPGFVVVGVARRSSVLVEGCCGTLSKVYSVDLVRLLVVPGHDSHTTDLLLNSLLTILATLFGLFSQVLQVL